LAKEKDSKKQKFEQLRILNALIRQADRFLGSETETPRTVVSVWHGKALVIIAEVAGRNSKEMREFSQIQLEPPAAADRYFRKRLGQFLRRQEKDKVVDIPKSKRWQRRRAIAEVKEILLGIKLKLRS